MGGLGRWLQGAWNRDVGSMNWELTEQDAFTDQNYQAFFNMTVEVLVRPWEKMVMGMRFTEVSCSWEIRPGTNADVIAWGYPVRQGCPCGRKLPLDANVFRRCEGEVYAASADRHCAQSRRGEPR